MRQYLDDIEFKTRLYRNISWITLAQTETIAVIRIDTLVAPTLVEFSYLIKYTIFNFFRYALSIKQWEYSITR